MFLLVINFIIVFFIFIIIISIAVRLNLFNSFWLMFKKFFGISKNYQIDQSEAQQIAVILSDSLRELSRDKMGAFITINKNEDFSNYTKLGVEINGILSKELITTIFFKPSPLHDGAIIIEGNKIVCASCFFPVDGETKISRKYGSRHRAAISISKKTQSLSLIVSETDGSISYAISGKLVKLSNAIDALDVVFNYLK